MLITPTPPIGARPAVLVATTTWWPSVAILASSLERAGFEVTLLCPRGHVGHLALHFRCLVLDRWRPLASLAGAIRALQPALVVPGDDRAVAHLIRLGQERDPVLRAAVLRSLGPAASHPALTERVALLRAAESAGVLVPAFRSFRYRDDLEDWLATVPAPWVIKADGAWGGEGVAVVSSRDAARQAVRRLGRGPSAALASWRAIVNGDPFWMHDRRAHRRRSVSAQRFVAGRAGTCALFAQDGVILGATTVEAEATYVANGPSTVFRPVDRPAFLDGAQRLVGRLRLSGFIGLDFMVDDATGQALLIEMNPRITNPARMQGPFGLAPVSAAAQALGCSGVTPTTPRERFAAFPLAWLADPFAAELRGCGDDCPWHEPSLLRASLQTLWPERGLFAALPSRLRGWSRRFIQTPDLIDYRDRPLAWWVEQGLLGASSPDRVPATGDRERRRHADPVLSRLTPSGMGHHRAAEPVQP